MTLPHERTKAVLDTELFLKRLIDPKHPMPIPNAVKAKAKELLRHYPTKMDIDNAVRGYGNALVGFVSECPFSKYTTWNEKDGNQ